MISLDSILCLTLPVGGKLATLQFAGKVWRPLTSLYLSWKGVWRQARNVSFVVQKQKLGTAPDVLPGCFVVLMMAGMPGCDDMNECTPDTRVRISRTSDF